MKRILAFTLIFAMLFTAMLGIMPSAEQELTGETQNPTLYISRANLQFDTTIYLLIEVDYGWAGFANDPGVKVAVTHGDETTILEPDPSIEGLATECVGFKYTDLSAKEMADTLTITAYCDGADVGSDTTTYSLLEYAIKAKATYPGSKLATACEAMLAFGAAAQDAFGYEGEYALADENGNVIDYGMVIVGGAEQRKTMVKVGESFAPVADSDTFAEPTLYDMSFNAVADNSISEVASGISRYFYYGAELTGNADKFVNADARTHADKNLFNNINFAEMFGGVQMDDTIEITSRTGITQTTEVGYKGKISGKLDNGNTFVVKPGYYRTWGLHPYKNAATAATSATLKQRMGYLYVNTPANTESDTNYLSIFNNMTANVSALADAENKITVSVALAVTEANYANTTIEAGFTPTYGGNTQGSVWRGDPRAFLFTVKDGVMYAGDNQADTAKIADLQKIGDSWTNGTKLVMVHFVLDLNRETVTAYNSATGDSVIRSQRINKTFFDQAYNQIFNMRISGEVYVSRITISEGDIFN